MARCRVGSTSAPCHGRAVMVVNAGGGLIEEEADPVLEPLALQAPAES